MAYAPLTNAVLAPITQAVNVAGTVASNVAATVATNVAAASGTNWALYPAQKTINANTNWISGDGGAEGLFIDGSGNVTSSASLFLRGSLSVNGSANVSGTQTNTTLVVYNTNALASTVVANGSFDVNISGWGESGATTYIEPGIVGGNCVVVSNSSAFSYIYQSVSVLSNRVYRFSVWYKKGSGDGRCRIGTTFGGLEYVEVQLIASGTNLLTHVFKPVSNTVWIRLGCDGVVGSYMYFDEVAFQEIGGNVAVHGLVTGNGTDGLKIAPNGWLGVLTNDPAATLHVRGPVICTTNFLYWVNATSWVGQTASINYLLTVRNSNSVLTIITNTWTP
jgi:hypothetical protein